MTANKTFGVSLCQTAKSHYRKLYLSISYGVIFLLTLFSILVSADSFTLKLSGHFYTSKQDVHVIFHVPYRAENRWMRYEWLGENNDGGSSTIELVEGDHVTRQVTFERWIKHSLEGAHVVSAVLHATDGDYGPIIADYEVR